jgi:GDP-L-fucose synthase
MSAHRPLSIRELATAVAAVAGYAGRAAYDTAEPDGMPREFFDATRLTELGWRASTPLKVGLEHAYRWLTDRLAAGAPIRGWESPSMPGGPRSC